MNLNHMLTDKVRAALLKRGVITWGVHTKEEVNQTSQMLQQIVTSGELVFRKRLDGSYSLLHLSLGYGSRNVVLGKYTDILLGARIRNGVPFYDSPDSLKRIKERLDKLGVNVPIKML